MQTQGSKDFFRSKKSKPKDSQPILSCDDMAELAKIKNKKDRKKRFRGQRREHIQKRKKQTTATGVNITEADSKKNYPYITYYKCEKKYYHFKIFPETPKN